MSFLCILQVPGARSKALINTAWRLSTCAQPVKSHLCEPYTGNRITESGPKCKGNTATFTSNCWNARSSYTTLLLYLCLTLSVQYFELTFDKLDLFFGCDFKIICHHIVKRFCV